MKKLTLVALTSLLAAPLSAQNAPTAPKKWKIERVATPEHPEAIALYGDRTPGSVASEVWIGVSGYPIGVRNVTRPVLIPVLPDPARATGAAVIVAPGGAFMELAWHSEGISVARALADRGIAAFILKYRLIPTPVDEAEARVFMGRKMGKEIGGPMNGPLLKQSLAPADAKAAIAMVRAGAAQWKIDPARVGIIGFSAGAMTARRVAIDAPTAERPDFIGYIYGPQDGEIVPNDVPPLFDAIALDDPLFQSKDFAIATAWHTAKRPVEIHAYQTGGHGFGLGQPGMTTAMMLDQFVQWMDMNGFLKARAKR